MPFIKFTDDQTVKRLRWVMIAAMLFSLGNTLAGQPAEFWHHPEAAIRGDGLSIDNATNHTFDFFLGAGWLAYVLACLVYFSAAFLAVSVLPRIAALMVIFSLLFGHYFGASNWLAVRWHAGVAGPSAYGYLLGAILALSAFPASAATDSAIKRLRWVMVATILLDFTVTLAGQPASYWLHPDTVHEANPLSKLFLGLGWMAFCLYAVLYAWGVFLLVTYLPRMIAVACIFAFIFFDFNGASCWFFYQWRMGMAVPVIYGIILGAIIVLLAFFKPAENPQNA